MRVPAVVAVVLAFAAAALAAEPKVLIDFETGEPTDGWKCRNLGLGELSLADGATPSSGRALELRAEDRGGSYVGYVYRDLPPADWRSYSALSLHARVRAEEPVEMRIIAFEEGGGGRALLRRFTLPPGEWREVVLPLSAFRENLRDQVGTFARIGGLTIRWDRGSGAVALDDLRLLPGDRGEKSCLPTVEERLSLAFPDGNGDALVSEHFVLLTNVRKLRGSAGKRLLGRLEEALTLLGERYRVTGTLPEKVPFVVFETYRQFQEFYKRFGDHLGVDISPPTADGYSALGVVASTWDKRQGWDRSVYVHEATHGAVYRLLSLGSNGNWIQEGLAAAVQARIHPESVEDVDFAAGFGGRFLPFEKLFAKRRQPTSRYAQLLTIMDYLAERHGDELPKVWEAVRRLDEPVHESAPPAIAKVLGVSVAEMEVEWRKWGAETHWKK